MPSYSQTRVRERKREYYRIQNSIQRLSQNYADGNSIDIAKYEQLRTEVYEYMKAKNVDVLYYDQKHNGLLNLIKCTFFTFRESRTRIKHNERISR